MNYCWCKPMWAKPMLSSASQCRLSQQSSIPADDVQTKSLRVNVLDTGLDVVESVVFEQYLKSFALCPDLTSSGDYNYPLFSWKWLWSVFYSNSVSSMWRGSLLVVNLENDHLHLTCFFSLYWAFIVIVSSWFICSAEEQSPQYNQYTVPAQQQTADRHR